MVLLYYFMSWCRRKSKEESLSFEMAVCVCVCVCVCACMHVVQYMLFSFSLRLLRLFGQSLELFYSLRHVGEGKEPGSGNEAVGTRGGTNPDRFLRRLDPAIDLDVDVQLSIDDPFSDLLDLGNHRRDELLSPESGVHRHDQNVVHQIQNVFHHFGRRVGVECHRGRTPGRSDLGEGPVQVGACLDVDNDNAGFSVGSLADLHELVEHGLGAFLADHELGLERQVCVLSAVLDRVGSECYVGDKVSVHHIELDAVAAGIFHSLHVGTEISKVAREDRGDDLHLAGFAVYHCC
mmetsp:Transcript_6321/g.15672  ORF Transcript_6321/g.15672 Transcript_6321/m.15672 type:complete len:292 (+) Transcript_6321:1955-2830(+)